MTIFWFMNGDGGVQIINYAGVSPTTSHISLFLLAKYELVFVPISVFVLTY